MSFAPQPGFLWTCSQSSKSDATALLYIVTVTYVRYSGTTARIELTVYTRSASNDMSTSHDLWAAAEVLANVRHMDLPDRVVRTKVAETVSRLGEAEVVLHMRTRLDEKHLQLRVRCRESSCSHAGGGSGCK